VPPPPAHAAPKMDILRKADTAVNKAKTNETLLLNFK